MLSHCVQHGTYCEHYCPVCAEEAEQIKEREELRELDMRREATMADYRVRTTEVMVHPASDSTTLSEMITRVRIDDEGGGEFVRVEQANTGAILINPDEWQAVREAVDRMVAGCRDINGGMDG